MSEVQKAAENWLTPTVEEQAELIKKKQCPHNKGWAYYCSGHNDSAYTCNLCGKMDYY
jgi:hypothetical protein